MSWTPWREVLVPGIADILGRTATLFSSESHCAFAQSLERWNFLFSKWRKCLTHGLVAQTLKWVFVISSSKQESLLHFSGRQEGELLFVSVCLGNAPSFYVSCVGLCVWVSQRGKATTCSTLVDLNFSFATQPIRSDCTLKPISIFHGARCKPGR